MGDVIVTKPGGLITSEALACGLMIVVVDPYAGQEDRNASMLLEEGAAIQVHHHELASVRLDPILSDPERLAQYKKNAKRLARPNAARKIASSVREHLFAGQADEECPRTPPRNRNERSLSLDMAGRTVSGDVSPTCWFESSHSVARWPA